MSTVHSTESSQAVRAFSHDAHIDLAGGNDGTFTMREQIESRVAAVEYVVDRRTRVLCFITLDNGFVQSGESPCVDPAVFNWAKSGKLAYADAVDKLCSLFGFVACEDAHRENLDRQRATQVRPVI